MKQFGLLAAVDTTRILIRTVQTNLSNSRPSGPEVPAGLSAPAMKKWGCLHRFQGLASL